MIDYQEDNQEKAIRQVLAILRQPLALMSVSDREAAYALVSFHKITAEDLLEAAAAQARNH